MARPHLRLGDVGRLLVVWAGSTVAIVLAARLVPGLSADSPWSYAAVAAVAGVTGLVVRPLLAEVSARLGWLALLALALVGQAVIVYVAVLLVPGIQSTFMGAMWASWVVAAFGTLLSWAFTAGTDDGLVTSLLRRGGRPPAVPDPDVDGVVFVQLDGVPFPVLQWAVRAGGVPTIRRWLSSQSHRLHEWTPQLPCTTPASQLGVLHGTVAGVPAFRWYDRALDRVLVSNRPADARLIEDRTDRAYGLLSDDGVSISNLFSGGAERSMLTMSRLGASRGSLESRRALAWFMASPNGFMRSFTRTIVEILKERWQAHRQARRGLEPRMHRGWTFAALRAVTNALLRDLNTALVAEEMRRGTRAIYVDYVDYDEIAHHAGMFRPESLAALDGLDRVLGHLERLAQDAPRRYRIVVLSDHGQSQGRPFADRHGADLGHLCAELMAEEVTTLDADVEGWGRAQSILGDVGTQGVSGRVAVRAERLTQEHTTPAAPSDPVIVLGSGNLGLLYVRGTQRLTLEELDSRWPRLVPGLAQHPGIGFVAGLDERAHAWAIGPRGSRDLTTGESEGHDPLAPFGAHAPRVLRRAVMMPDAPDLYVNSAVDLETDDVAAFEDLVGAHGGLGGWQDRALLLVPSEWSGGLDQHIEGADHLHECLVRMLAASGHRVPARVPTRDAPRARTQRQPDSSMGWSETV